MHARVGYRCTRAFYKGNLVALYSLGRKMKHTCVGDLQFILLHQRKLTTFEPFCCT